jgi:hypothetical protein
MLVAGVLLPEEEKVTHSKKKKYHANAIAHAGKIVAEHANVLWVQARSKSEACPIVDRSSIDKFLGKTMKSINLDCLV